MKRSIAIIAFSVLLLVALSAAGAGKRVKPERKTPTVVEQKTQPTRTTPATPTPTPQSTKTTLETPTPAPQPTSEEAVRRPTPPTMGAESRSATYAINWQSINGGGEDIQSASYEIQSSIGQSVIGYATSASYEAGNGYWYGVAGGGVPCSCPYQCDYDADGFLTALDLGALIDVLFAGHPEVHDPSCLPASRGDFNNDGFPDALDLSGLIDHLFAGQPGPCDPCNPVQSTCAP